jgi:four helix bundle protein
MFKFEKLEVWKKAVEVSILSRAIDQKDQFSVAEQVRRASLSVSTNIAEATGRDGQKESRYLFNIAKGSVYKVVSLLHVIRARGYVVHENFDILYAQWTRLSEC